MRKTKHVKILGVLGVLQGFVSLTGWSESSCGTNATCAVSVESNVSLTATFDPS